MPKRDIVFVIGASSEVNLPVGAKLKHQLADLLNIHRERYASDTWSGDELIFRSLNIHIKDNALSPRDLDVYLAAARAIRDAMPLALSIDNYLDTHNKDEKIRLCGKLAIIRGILKAEQNSSPLYLPGKNIHEHPDFSGLEQTWLNSFFQLITENCEITDLASRLKSIVLIIFNYDRCVEHFLYHALQKYYRITPDEAADLMNGMPIYHPYGTVGHLPWQPGKNSVIFGNDPSAQQLLVLAQQIKTFTEGTDPGSSEILAIRQSISKANVLVFMGFAFHKLNIELLTADRAYDSVPAKYKFYATARGISDSNRELIIREIHRMKGKTRALESELRNDLQCSQIIYEYWRSLSLA